MVLDDDETIVELLRTVLAEAGHEAITASRPAADAEYWTADVVITDLVSPGGYDPEDARARVREVRERFGVPVIVCTAHRQAAYEPDRLGADQVIAKPFDVDSVVGAVDRLVK
jgi:DNA-binding response OmpR family regulator